MKLTPVYLDFESWWSTTHSLSKMTNIEYVMHPDTEIISLSMKVGHNAATMVYFGDAEIRRALKTVDWSKSMAIGHNMSGFDALILSWRFGINPAMWGCTLAMARSKYNASVGGSLGKLVAHFAPELEAMGISGVKDNSALLNTKGKNLKDFTPEEIRLMGIYNKTDTEQCCGLFKILARETPAAELLQIDLTTRMLTEPQFVVDKGLLQTTLSAVQEEKLRSLKELVQLMLGPDEVANIVLEGGKLEDYARTQLMSAAKFSEILTKRGVEVPMKPSPSDPSKQIPALSKTDQAFLDLQDNDDPVVACAARARLEAKSTLLETRINAFMQASGRLKGYLPMPLRYCGATTTGRWSGEIFNPQNLPRIDPTNPKLSDALRNSLRAPAGYKVVTSDLSGIELRINHFLWQVRSSMNLFQADPAKADLYREFAANLYTVPNKADVTKQQRQMGKLCIAENTLILAKRGSVSEWIPIQEFTPDRQLWDGKEWVWAKGVVSNGWKPTLQLCGVSLTPDHLVLSGTQWLESQHVQGESIVRALEIGAENLRLPDIWLAKKAVSKRYLLSAIAGFLSTRLKQTTLKILSQLGVTAVRLNQAPTLVSCIGVTPQLSPMMNTENGCLTDSLLRLTDVEKKLTPDTTTTVEGAFEYTLNGLPTGVNSFAMLSRLKVGITQNLKWIGKTVTETMNPAISVLSAVASTWGTKGKSLFCNNASSGLRKSLQVFDILNCGPRNRFTVLTNRGPMVVHNCHLGLGFGAGPGTFQRIAKMMGGVDMELEEAKTVVETWREEYKEIAAGWRTCHDALTDIANGRESAIDPWGLCTTGKDHIQLPSGRKIWYPDLHREVGTDGKKEWIYGEGRNRARIYAGKVDENIVQALAADCLRSVVRRMYKQYDVKPALLVHDEYVLVIKETRAEEIREKLDDAMRTPPTWWPHLVTWSESGIGDTYGEAH